MKKKVRLGAMLLLLMLVAGSVAPIKSSANTTTGKKKMFLRVCFGSGDRCQINPNPIK